MRCVYQARLSDVVLPVCAAVPEAVGEAERAPALGLAVRRRRARDASVFDIRPLLAVGVGLKGELVGLARAATAALPNLFGATATSFGEIT